MFEPCEGVFLLIVPYGIEIRLSVAPGVPLNTFNRTLWN